MNLPKISIIITSYLPEAKPYLELCLESVRNLDYPKELLDVLIVSKFGYAPLYDGVRTVAPLQHEYDPAVGVNFGVKNAFPESEYFFILNDDVILTKQSLLKLVQYQSNKIGVLMPIGNDQQGKYHAYVGIEPGQYKFDQLKDSAKFLMNNQSAYPGLLTFHETLCTYAFLLSRKAYEAIGPFDEDLIGQDDIDYTLRASRAGYVNAIAYDSLVYHFGGVSADQTFNDERRKKSLEIFNKKWNP